MKTNHVIRLAAAAAVAALIAPGVFAQASVPVSRAAVKSETKAAESAGTLTPAGEGPGSKGFGDTGDSSKTTAEQRANTTMERKMGGLTPAGEGGVNPDHMTKARAHSRNRAAVKSETKAAERAGTLQPAGEAPQPSSDSPKK